MKLLILSCHTGQGHNAAALAIEKELLARNIPCDFKDTLAYAGETTSRVVDKSYVFTTRLPRLFQGIYKAGAFVSSDKRRSPVYGANTLYADAMMQDILSNGYDTVITSHLFAAEALTYLSEKKGLTIPWYTVATDYTCIPFWEETRPTHTFIAHPSLIPEYIEKGVPAHMMTPTGIPVDDRFTHRLPKEKARDLLSMSREGKMYLIMTGSMGFGHTENTVTKLAALCTEKDTIRILTGRNRRLFNRIAEMFAGDPRILPIAFTDQVPILMDAADVLLTKPGGLTSTEAAAKGIPLVLTNPIPGCETKNADLFRRLNMALIARNSNEAAAAAAYLASHPETCTKMIRAQRENIPEDAAAKICSFVLGETVKP